MRPFTQCTYCCVSELYDVPYLFGAISLCVPVISAQGPHADLPCILQMLTDVTGVICIIIIVTIVVIIIIATIIIIIVIITIITIIIIIIIMCALNRAVLRSCLSVAHQQHGPVMLD